MSKSPSSRPLSIRIIAIMYFVTGAYILTPYAEVDVFGFGVPGPATLILKGLYCSLYMVLAAGLACLSNWARWGSIIYEIYHLGGSSVQFLAILHAMATRDTEAFSYIERRASEFDLGLPPTLLGYAIVLMAFVLLAINVLILWFLIKRKAAFVKPTLST